MGLFRRNKKKPIRNPKPQYDPTARFRRWTYTFPSIHQLTYESCRVQVEFPQLKMENITIHQPETLQNNMF